MCKSLANGGQRCAAHTRAAYFKACETNSVTAIDETGKNYASTREGREYFADQMRALEGRPTGNPEPRVGFVPDYDLAEIANRDPEAYHLHRIIQDGDRRRMANTQVAERIRGAKGEWSAEPTREEISGYLDEQERQYEQADNRYMQSVLADTMAEHNADEPDPTQHLTSLAIAAERNPNGGGLHLGVTAIEIDGQPLDKTNWKYRSLRSRLNEKVRTSLGENPHRVRFVRRSPGNELIAHASTPTGEATMYAARRDAARQHHIAATHTAIAKEMPEGVHSVTYEVTDRRGLTAVQVHIVEVVDANGHDARDKWSNRKYQRTLARTVQGGSMAVYLHSQHETLTVTRDAANWRPTPMGKAA